MIFPADLIDAGTFAASFESTLTDGVADALAPVVPLPHADIANAASTVTLVRPSVTARHRAQAGRPVVTLMSLPPM
jgi:hypothetical protein